MINSMLRSIGWSLGRDLYWFGMHLLLPLGALAALAVLVVIVCFRRIK